MSLTEILAQIPTIAYIFFAAGVILAIAEFCIPGFGLCGIASIVCFLASIIMASRSLATGIVFTALVLLTVAVIVIVFSIFASRGRFIKPLTLSEKLDSNEGFSSSRSFEELVGKTGLAVSILRPSGRVKIDGEVYDVITNGEFIQPGTEVSVVSAEGSRIEVKQLAE